MTEETEASELAPTRAGSAAKKPQKKPAKKTATAGQKKQSRPKSTKTSAAKSHAEKESTAETSGAKTSSVKKTTAKKTTAKKTTAKKTTTKKTSKQSADKATAKSTAKKPPKKSTKKSATKTAKPKASSTKRPRKKTNEATTQAALKELTDGSFNMEDVQAGLSLLLGKVGPLLGDKGLLTALGGLLLPTRSAGIDLFADASPQQAPAPLSPHLLDEIAANAPPDLSEQEAKQLAATLAWLRAGTPTAPEPTVP